MMRRQTSTLRGVARAASWAIAGWVAVAPVWAADLVSQRIAQPALYGVGAQAPATGNTSAPSNWRLTAGMSFNGVAGAFDGTALLLFTTTEAAGTYACSGSLMHGGQWVLTAAHCVDGLISMSVQFGYTNNVALETRSVVQAVAHPGWNGSLDTGADIALVKLNAPVTNLPSYTLSTTNDVGKTYVMTGYGTSGTGSATSGPDWADGAYGHYGYNVFDTTSAVFGAAWDAYSNEGIYVAPTYGQTYISDFDPLPTVTNASRYNSLARIAALTGNLWTSDAGLGVSEALIAGGDSGGGDFIWDGSQWVLSAVHSWGWQFCSGRISPNCDYRTGNSSSYGDLAGSTAVFSHVAWINSVIAVPEPGSVALMLAGLAVVGGAARRRRR